jgi:hypothetical protein
MSDQQTARRLEKALADDERTGELGIRVRATGRGLVAHGEVASEDRRQAVLAVLRDLEPGIAISDQLTLSGDAMTPPEGTEKIETTPL